MKVYLIYQYVEYENDVVVAVKSTKEDAEKTLAWLSQGHGSYYIEEESVDDPEWEKAARGNAEKEFRESVLWKFRSRHYGGAHPYSICKALPPAISCASACVMMGDEPTYTMELGRACQDRKFDGSVVWKMHGGVDR